jgi:hypothetical protein
LRVVFDKNVPIGVRRFLAEHEVRTFEETGWPLQVENGDLPKAAEAEGFDVVVTSDQNIRYQQNLTGRRLSLVVLGSNIWPLVSRHAASIGAAVARAAPGSYEFIEVPLPPKPRHERES